MLVCSQVVLKSIHSFGRSIIVFRRPLAWVSLLLALLCIGVGTLFLLQVLDGSKGWLGLRGGVAGLVLIAAGLAFLLLGAKPGKGRLRKPAARQASEDGPDLESLVRWHEDHEPQSSVERNFLDQELQTAASGDSHRFGIPPN